MTLIVVKLLGNATHIPTFGLPLFFGLSGAPYGSSVISVDC